MNDVAEGQPTVVVPVNGNGCKPARSWRRFGIVALVVISLMVALWIIFEHGPVADKAWEFLNDFLVLVGLAVTAYIGADTYQKVKTPK